MADTLGSVGVIISTILIHYFHWTGFDPIASLLIGLMILGSVVPLVIDCGKILCLDLSSTDTSAVEHALAKVTAMPGVRSISAPRFWPLDGGSLIGSIVCSALGPLTVQHVQTESDTHGEQSVHTHISSTMDPAKLALEVEALLLHEIPGLESVTVQVNTLDEVHSQ